MREIEVMDWGNLAVAQADGCEDVSIGDSSRQENALPCVRVFDTTLRDGEQSPGCSMTLTQKLDVARQLALLNVDIIEAGFPASSPGEVEAVRAIASEVGTHLGPVICGLARATEKDIACCASAIEPATYKRLHTFLATSDIHLERKLALSKPQALARISEMVAYARSLCDDVEFSAEDAARSDRGFLCEALQAALEAGATTLNVPDTVGYTVPWEYRDLIRFIRQRIQHSGSFVLSTHCHNDLGVAVANSLAGVEAGARQVECTVNGIGERAGNASLEEIVMALHTRQPLFGVRTRINTQEIMRTSQLVAKCTRMTIARNKAVVGANAFLHEAGIHQDGVLKDRRTYEIMDATSVGAASDSLVLGKHSGRRAFRHHLEKVHGVSIDGGELDEVFAQFKRRADDGTRVTTDEIGTMIPSAIRRRQIARTQSSHTIVDKIWRSHSIKRIGTSGPEILYVDLHLIHEVTSPQAFATLRAKGVRVRKPAQTLATLDHSTPTTLPGHGPTLRVLDSEAAVQIEQLERNCAEYGIRLHGMESEHRGIVHVIGPEQGVTRPGLTIVCGDSHTTTHGAFGALAFGIGTSEVAHVLATQCIAQSKPKVMEVRIDGELEPGVTAKDVILALIAKIGVGGGTGHVLEFTGSAVRALDMEGRMTLCNMAIEAGARAGLIAPDDTTFEYMHGRAHAPSGRAWDEAVRRWRMLPSDEDAEYDERASLNARGVKPMITFGTNPGMAIPIDGCIPDPASMSRASDRASLIKALQYMDLTPGEPILGRHVDVVFIGSCTNSRITDLRHAAKILRGRRIASGVRMLVVPGSQQIKRQAESEGLHDVFRAAGAEWRESGCSMCIAMNGDRLESGQYAISTSNRNFEGRQGKGGRTLLASPITAAASAINGFVSDARTMLNP